jgi:hypothetical protein
MSESKKLRARVVHRGDPSVFDPRNSSLRRCCRWFRIISVTDTPPTAREIIDNEHLRILSIVHFVWGGLCAAMSCILIVHFVAGLFIATAPQFFGHGPQGPPAFVGLLMSTFAGCMMIMGWLFGGLTIYSGVCLKNRQHRTFSFVMAIVNCLSIPFGTTLGLFTIVVLMRDSVKRLYDQAANPGARHGL